MKKLCFLFALGALIPSGGLMALVSEPLFLYEADPYFSFTAGTGDASAHKRALNRELAVGKHQGAALAFGYKYTSWRFELEAAFRTTEIQEFMRFEERGGPIPAPSPDPFFPGSRFNTYEAEGSVRNTALMINSYYDFPTGRIWRPYAGGGLGVSHLAVHDLAFPNSRNPERHSDSEFVLAFQLMVGVLFELAPETDLTIGYRYFGTEDVTWRVADPNERGATESIDLTGTNVHLFEVGIHVNF